MALDNYTDLQAAIAAWLDRSDLAAVIPDFITLFETTANAELPLRTRYNLAEATLDTVANTQTVALPSDFLEAKALVNTDGSLALKVVPYYTPAALYKAFPYALLASGRPRGFTYVGSTIELAPTPDQVYPLRLYYYQRIPALATATGGVNWLLENFPNLYLFGSLVAAEAYLGSDPRIQTWAQLYQDLTQKLADANERGQYGGAPLVASSDAVV